MGEEAGEPPRDGDRDEVRHQQVDFFDDVQARRRRLECKERPSSRAEQDHGAGSLTASDNDTYQKQDGDPLPDTLARGSAGADRFTREASTLQRRDLPPPITVAGALTDRVTCQAGRHADAKGATGVRPPA